MSQSLAAIPKAGDLEFGNFFESAEHNSNDSFDESISLQSEHEKYRTLIHFTTRIENLKGSHFYKKIFLEHDSKKKVCLRFHA